MTGWQTFCGSFLLVHPFVLLVDLRGLMIVPIVVAINSTMAFAPPLDLMLRGRLSAMCPLYAAFAIAVLLIPKDVNGNLFFGYWVWFLSIVAMCMISALRTYVVEW